MGRNRRNIGLEDPSAWIFNRMADVYDARPAYPTVLIDAIARLAMLSGGRVLDVGAGIGHLALPLGQRGLDVVAIEPAKAMLERLESAAVAAGIELRTLHAAAERLPCNDHSFDLAVIVDALHFLDAELVAAQLRRVLVPGGTLAMVTCEFTDTPFMSQVRELVHASADRRARDVGHAILQLATLAEVRLTERQCFRDETAVDLATIERILRSVSFVGPAMNPQRFSAIRDGLRAIAHEPRWARTFTLYAGRKKA